MGSQSQLVFIDCVSEIVYKVLHNDKTDLTVHFTRLRMSPSLQGKVCLVTGAARGIGRGIALQLGQAGATVYITGRTKKNLDDCAEEIKARGGIPVTVQMDHGVDSEVEQLFDQIKKEQNGKLDLLVNNAYAGVSTIFNNSGKKFWDMEPVSTWDTINGVGLRGHYICTTLASRMMVPKQQGLIVNVSSSGGLKYLFNVAYGVGKAACDRMAADCGFELKKSGVSMVSLWPGPVKTDNQMAKVFEKGETIEYAGKAVVHLAADKNIMARSGKIINTADIGREFGFVDITGESPIDFRQVKVLVAFGGHPGLAAWIPDFIRVPLWLMHFGSYKF